SHNREYKVPFSRFPPSLHPNFAMVGASRYCTIAKLLIILDRYMKYMFSFLIYDQLFSKENEFDFSFL
ncbi:MAG: hypothetical protein WC608_05830, partial [Parcubacteria group bacterium]